MKVGLDHLPSRKQRELAFVVRQLQEAFAASAPDVGGGQLLMIVLYGSYARGDFVDDRIGGYHSDYDILLVVDREPLTDMIDVWGAVEDLLVKACLAGGVLQTPVSLIAHTLQEVDDMLERGRAFFLDVLRDGVVLHAEPGAVLTAPGVLSPQMVLQEARDYRRAGLEAAETFLHGSAFYRAHGRPNEAAFALHQAAEGLYTTLILSLTLYSAKSHNLNRLRWRAEALAPELAEVWTHDGKLGRRAYERLREAYVKARHSRAYVISEPELDWLCLRLDQLRAAVALRTAAYLTELQRVAS